MGEKNQVGLEFPQRSFVYVDSQGNRVNAYGLERGGRRVDIRGGNNTQSYFIREDESSAWRATLFVPSSRDLVAGETVLLVEIPDAYIFVPRRGSLTLHAPQVEIFYS